MDLNSKDGQIYSEKLNVLLCVRGNLFEPVISSIYSTSTRQIPITSLDLWRYINQHDDKT